MHWIRKSNLNGGMRIACLGKVRIYPVANCDKCSFNSVPPFESSSNISTEVKYILHVRDLPMIWAHRGPHMGMKKGPESNNGRPPSHTIENILRATRERFVGGMFSFFLT